MVLLESILFGIWALNLVLVVCEFGQKMSDEYEGVVNALSKLDWYQLPTDIQRMLPIIFMYCQEPLIVEFFGSLSVSRWQFKKARQDQLTFELTSWLIRLNDFCKFSGDEFCLQLFYDTS